MVVVAFTVYVIGLLAKMSKLVGGVNLAETKELLEVCCYLYFGRSIAKVADKLINTQEEKKEENKNE
jgi:hypothetical protein